MHYLPGTEISIPSAEYLIRRPCKQGKQWDKHFDIFISNKLPEYNTVLTN